jgi:hypothetical protein
MEPKVSTFFSILSIFLVTFLVTFSMALSLMKHMKVVKALKARLADDGEPLAEDLDDVDLGEDLETLEPEEDDVVLGTGEVKSTDTGESET